MKTTEQPPAVKNLISAAAQAGEQFTVDDVASVQGWARKSMRIMRLCVCPSDAGEQFTADDLEQFAAHQRKNN